MGFWQERVVPVLIDRVMASGRLVPLRRRLVAPARGDVLEIGIGGGANLPFYGRGVRRLVGVDPSPRLLARARERAAWMPFPVLLHEGGAEELPFADASFDVVVSAWTLCSIPDVERALAEVRRVLRPGGVFRFVEHGLCGADPRTAAWQYRLTPLWRRVAGGCHLDRPVDRLLERAGLAPEELEVGKMLPGPRILTWHYVGQARPLAEDAVRRERGER